MFSKNQTNIQRVLICGNVPDSGVAAGTKIGSAALTSGEVIITSESGTIVDSTNVANFSKLKFTQYRGADSIPNTSDVIDLKRVKRISAVPYRAATEQSVVIGYNPATTAGGIDVLNLNTYYLRVYDKADSKLGFAQQDITQSHMVSDSSATQAEIAIKLVDILTANVDRKADCKLLVECVGDISGATAGAVIGEVTFTNGSNAATFDGTAAIGEYVAAGNVVYLVTSVVGNVAFLDREFTGASGAVGTTAVTTSFRVTSSATPFGIRITGLPNSFRVGNEHYRKTRFEVQLKDFGSTPVTVLATADAGVGTQSQVEELELWASGHNFKHYRKDFQYEQVLDSRSLAASVATDKWSTLNIEYDELTTGGIGPRPVSPKVLTICFQLQSATPGTGSLSGTKSGKTLVDAINAASIPNAEFKTADGATVDLGVDV